MYNGKVLLEKHDPPAVYDSEETLQLAQESLLKMKQLNKEIKPTLLSKLQCLLLEIKPTLLSKALEFEIERLLGAVVSQDIISIVQNPTVVETSDLQTELERTKERFENCIIKKENEYAKLWNDWINPFKTYREEKFVPNKPIKASVRTKPITVSQPHVITKKDVNYDSNGNLKLLINFVWKFLGTVLFGNDHVAAILGYGDLQWGNILITKVYFVEGLGHNLFSVGQFYDSDLDVAFRRNTCFVRNLKGVDLLKRNRTTNLYTINIHEMASASPICLMARATSTKALCYPKNDREDIGKLRAKGDIGFFIGYSANSRAYRVYNRRTKKIMETMNVTFDEL
ncbi:hypothetical protein Tco_0508751 [Tanacetum coccineum]